MLPGGKTIMVTTLSLKKKLSAVALCLTLMSQQTTSAKTPFYDATATQQVGAFVVAPLVDALLINFKKLFSVAGLKSLPSLIKQQYTANIIAKNIAAKTDTETRFRYLKRFIATYGKTSPILCLLILAELYNAGDTLWTAYGAEISATLGLTKTATPPPASVVTLISDLPPAPTKATGAKRRAPLSIFAAAASDQANAGKYAGLNQTQTTLLGDLVLLAQKVGAKGVTDEASVLGMTLGALDAALATKA